MAVFTYVLIMDETKLYSWFLGPKAENADLLERLILEALRDCVFWRRNFHPEDDILITEKVKREDAFQDSLALIRQEFLTLLANLKRDIPFYSPRYIGHMLGDQLLPAIAAYFAAMLHNPNNVTLEAAPITTQYELEVARQLARLMGYDGESWGHITSGGTIANFEALWVARNLKFFPIAVRDAARSLALEELPITLPTGETVNLVIADDNWLLLNLDTDETLKLRPCLHDLYAKRRTDLTQGEIEKQVNQQLAAHSISGKGIQRFFSDLGDEAVAAPLVLLPSTAHYSMQKIIEALGLGKQQIEMIPVDSHFRIDVDALSETLLRCAGERRPVMALVSVLGSTEEGAVDQIHRLVEVQVEMRKHGLTFYHHCDAAWGGYVRTLFFDKEGTPVKTPNAIREITQTWPADEVFESYSAIHRADSVTIDPHKLGYIPYPCGAIVFRHEGVKEMITTDAPYIFDGEEKRDRPFIGRYILEGSKPGAAAAACWFAHRVVPLNQSGYGLLIGKSIQSTQELCYRLGRELAPELAREGINLRILTQPPDGNIFCFVVNRVGNTSLKEMNRINQAIYDELKFNPESVIQRHNFIISSTALSFTQYGLRGPQGRGCLDEHLAALGIPSEQFSEVGSVKVLRCTVMSPWLALSSGGNPDFSAAFAAVLKHVIRSAAAVLAQ
ncbi:MAG: pyridoxal-dependent decarboxylase [Acidobacteria bacterium]|nr:pyridoxal-dependent decarboxylase [Acidobacteriota bacterium]